MTPAHSRRIAIARGPDAACWSHSLGAGALVGHEACTAEWDPTPPARLREETAAALASRPAAIAVTSPAGVRRWIYEAGALRSKLMAALRRLPVVSHRPDAVDACISAGIPARAVHAESEEQVACDLARDVEESLVLETARWEPRNDTNAPAGGNPTRLVQPYRYRLPYELDASTELVQRLIADDIDMLVLTSPASVVGLFEVAAETGTSSALRAALYDHVMVAAADRPTAAVAEQHSVFVSRCPLRTDGRDLVSMLSVAVHRPLLPARVLPAASAVEATGDRVRLSSLELRLFAALNRRQGLTCPRPVLAGEVWGHGVHGDRLPSLVSRLRRRITPLGLTIDAVQRRGYRLKPADA